MIRINLLPYRAARRRQQILQHLTVAAAGVFAALLVVLAGYWYTSSTVSSMEQELASINMQNAQLQKQIGEIKNLDRLRADVQEKLKLIDKLQGGRFFSLETLYGISKAIPENVWVTSIQDTGTEIKLTGMGESNKAVANFMRNLDASPLFSNIRLVVISRQMVGQLPMRNFNLVFVRESKLKSGTVRTRKSAKGRVS